MSVRLTPHLHPFTDGQKGRASLPEGSAQLGQEYNANLFHRQRAGYGCVSGGLEGSTNGTLFETYLEEVLLPTLKKGQVVVMDNLSAHKGERVREMIEGKGCQLVYLPPYSPDFNPIEQAFSKLKSYLRAACARSQDMLIEVIGKALSTITVSDAEGYFEHCGYRAVVQSL
jgi:transposase